MGRMYLASDMTPDSLDDVKKLAAYARGFITDIYMHWTAGWYGQAYDDYHICIDKDGGIYIMCDQFTERKSHTWQRNTNAVGISLCCCADACPGEDEDGKEINLGTAPPTMEQIEAMAQVLAVLAYWFDLRLDSDNHVMTHYEAAVRDGYGPGSGDPQTKWDLWKLPDYCGDGKMTDGGLLLRGKAAWYQRKWGAAFMAKWRGEFMGD